MRVIADQFYGEAKDVVLPFEEIASRLFQYAGLKVVSAYAKEYDITLFIEVEGKAIGKEYHSTDDYDEDEYSSHQYAGASLKGSIALKSVEQPDYKKIFEGNPSMESKSTPSLFSPTTI